MDAELVRKTLKIYNLTIKNAILIKLNTIMYLYETCHLPKKTGRKSKGVRDGVIGKPLKTSQKMGFLA